MAFRFADDVRPIVEMLANATMALNAIERGQFAAQHDANSVHGLGCYGYAYYGIFAIVKEVCGKEVADAMDYPNFGGNLDYVTDVEVAVQEAKDEIAEEYAKQLADID